MPISFEGYRRLVLKELTKVNVYRNFHVTVRAFEQFNALERFAQDVFPVIKACYDLGKSVEFAAKKLDTLTEMQLMSGVLNMVEEEFDRRQ